MFTGIVQGVAQVAAVEDRPGLRQLRLQFPPGFDTGLEIGASVACDGVCLTVTSRPAADTATFDVMQQTLSLTTLAGWAPGQRVNVERAARDGAEIGGHPLSGHVDTLATLLSVRQPQNEGWFEVWLIPETLRLTTFGDKAPGDRLNLEIERQTQVIVDTVHEAVEARLAPLQGVLERLSASDPTLRDALAALRSDAP